MSAFGMTRWARSIWVSVVLNCLLLGLGSFAYSILGGESTLLRIVLAFGWPSGAMISLLGPTTHDVTQEITRGIAAFAISIGIYACLTWLVLTLLSRVSKHQGSPPTVNGT
jgi:hypothetical protein